MTIAFGRVRLVTACVCALALSGCGAADSEDPRPQVAAAFYPLAYVASQVAGEHAVVTNLTTPGVEPHDLEPDPAAIARIAGADLLLFQQGFQPAIDKAAEQNSDGEVLDVSDVVELAPGADDADELDPHFWLDPMRMAALSEAVGQRLGELDPARRDSYATNVAALRAELVRLDEDFRAGLADCARRTVVVSHDAFGYLSKYDLDLESIVGLSPDAEPTPGDLARLRSLIENEGVTTVFAETLLSPALSETLAQEAGVTTAVLDPIEGLSDTTAGEDYVSLMRSNLAALREANQC
jgi:zinc transport system substrate-binding protein